ncbi:MAG: sugar ABC transporter substrate-binding protein, partial [Actinomycetota bacterium]|nr:sugar ABC transporter substrate-binding protein [Actinomycetota bacterium]
MKRTTSSVRILSMAAIAVLGAGLAACGGGGGGSSSASSAITAKGPIKIWYSNNEFEVKWGKEMVAAWNQAHPDQLVDAQEIPAGKSSEETIGAAITAGNAPCLVFNTAPVAVPQFQKQGGLVALDSFPDGAQYIRDRTGDLAEQYKSTDGKLY